jgi:hypothetical protein
MEDGLRDGRAEGVTAASVARMSEAISGFLPCLLNPAFRYAHAGYRIVQLLDHLVCNGEDARRNC